MEEKKYIQRIDDLGRIVIPRDLRQELMVHENDVFEISITTINGKSAFCAVPCASVGENVLRQARAAMVALAKQLPAGYELGLLDSARPVANTETGKKAWVKPNWPLLNEEARLIFGEIRSGDGCGFREVKEKEVLYYPIHCGDEVAMVLCIAGKDIGQDEAALARMTASVLSAVLV